MTMFGLALRALLVRGRTLAIAFLPLAIGIVAVIIRLAADPVDFDSAYATLGGNLLIGVVLSLVSLVIGVNAFDDEREGGTLPLLMSTSTPRWRIVGAKLAAAWITTVLVSLPAVVGIGVLGTGEELDTGKVWSSLLAATLLTAAAYTALFVLLSLVSGRGLFIGLAYVVIWEISLAGPVTALRNLSVAAYGRRVLGAPWAEDLVPFNIADVGVVVGGVVLAVAAAALGVLAVRRLPRIDAAAG
ncbi:ABC transporter permease subunit [Motilibacter aurantiacus]|uniref:ABC transporter permease subunit n=1 Tax=Motilibacter aurantiacus TaxID=2714955 RepID=UPI00140D1C10|nr:ABC transporter permease subunit [Motilibacter aurantiacus]NHC43872.1 ABC transporter permease subunit [Motilibacter aurantiacus]